MKETNRDLVRYISLTGIFTGLIIAMTFIPQVGYIQYGTSLDFTTLHAVTIMFILLAPKKHMWKFGIIFGTIFGFSSLMLAAQRGNPILINPLISVMPRLLFGAITGLLGQFILNEQVRRNRTKHMVLAAVIAAVSTLAHTVMVLVAIQLFANLEGFEAFKYLMQIAATINMPLEIAVAVLLALTTPRVYKAIKLA